MNTLYGILSADVVDSTSLDEISIVELNETVENCFADIYDYLSYDFWGRLVKGDSIECCMKNPNETLRLALLLKCVIKWWADNQECSTTLQQFGIRFSIGIGKMRSINQQKDIMDGEAIYIAGRNLDKITYSYFTSSFDMNSKYREFSYLIDNNIKLLDEIINSLSAKQSAVVYFKLLKFTETEIAQKLNISQSSVNNRLRLSRWKYIHQTIKLYESLDFYNI